MFFIMSIIIIFIILLIILGKSFNKKKIVQSYSVQSFLQGSHHDEDIYKEESMFEKINHFFESNKESSDSGDDGDDSCDE